MKPIIHTYTSQEPMLRVNAFIVEAEREIVIVDNENHTYMADGSILRWLANLEAYSPILKEYNALYVGHGPAYDISAIKKQKAYFLDYCSELLKATGGTAAFDEASKEQFEKTMLEKYPG